MNEVFLETLIELVSNNEKTIQETKGLVKGMPDHSQILAQIGARMDSIGNPTVNCPYFNGSYSFWIGLFTVS